MTNLEIIEAALNRLDPEREFREALMLKIATDLCYSVTPNKHLDVVPPGGNKAQLRINSGSIPDTAPNNPSQKPDETAS